VFSSSLASPGELAPLLPGLLWIRRGTFEFDPDEFGRCWKVRSRSLSSTNAASVFSDIATVGVVCLGGMKGRSRSGLHEHAARPSSEC
jgi:hypothetical protein